MGAPASDRLHHRRQSLEWEPSKVFPRPSHDAPASLFDAIAGCERAPYASGMAVQELTAPAQSVRRTSTYEYRSRLKIGSLPLIHIVRGVDPSTGSRPPAIGIIAIGQVAMGVVAIGQLAVGGVAIGQAALGLGWGVGQIAIGILAAGQVAAGAIGSVGQVALGPQPLGLIEENGPWAAMAWLVSGFVLAMCVLRRLHTLGPLVSRRTVAAPSISRLREGWGRVVGRVVSENHLRSPLSNRPCVYWQSLRVGPGVHMQERAGREIILADETGSAHLDLGGAVAFIKNDSYTELPAPDWSLYMETFLAKGDQLFVAGPVRLEPYPESSALYRGGAVSPVFRGEGDDPVVITTQSPDQLRAELRLGLGLAAGLVIAAAIAFGHAAAVGLLAFSSCGGVRTLGPRGVAIDV